MIISFSDRFPFATRICESWATRAPVGQYSTWPGMTSSFWRRCGFEAVICWLPFFIFIIGRWAWRRPSSCKSWCQVCSCCKNISRFSAHHSDIWYRLRSKGLQLILYQHRLLYEPAAKSKDTAAKVLWDVHLPGRKRTCILNTYNFQDDAVEHMVLDFLNFG